MENLKIRVNSEAESREVQELFLGLGYVKDNWLWSGYSDYPIELRTRDGGYVDFNLNAGNAIDRQEITLSQLRAMVNPMKEYLIPDNGGYRIAVQDAGLPIAEDWIAIPELSQFAVLNGDDEITFYDGNRLEKSHFISGSIVWQRESDQDEPFLTPECTLNDQYAEIEQVRQAEIHGTAKDAQASGGVDATLAERQSTYGSFEDVAFVTENIMSILAQVRVNGLNDLPNTHRMALYMIASKMARIVNGDFNHLDSWHDIGGYSKLIEKLIKGE